MRYAHALCTFFMTEVTGRGRKADTGVSQRVIRDIHKEWHCMSVYACVCVIVLYISIEGFEATSAGPSHAGGPGMCDR